MINTRRLSLANAEMNSSDQSGNRSHLYASKQQWQEELPFNRKKESLSWTKLGKKNGEFQLLKSKTPN